MARDGGGWSAATAAIPEAVGSSAACPGDLPAASPAHEKRKKKKNPKIRAAWIAFVGRITAQIFGAVATVTLGVLVLQKYQDKDAKPVTDTARPVATTTRTAAPTRSGAVSLAVLPVANFSADRRQDHMADGLTEALIAELARIDGVRVVSRTSSMQYKTRAPSVPQVAAELGVDLIVEASVVRSGDRVRITAQLIDAVRDEHVWARRYNFRAQDLLSLEEQAAAAVVRDVRATLGRPDRLRLAQRAADTAAGSR